MRIVNRRSVMLGTCAVLAMPSAALSTISGPEYFGVWQAVNLTSNITSDLERQTPREKARSKGLGGMILGKAEVFMEVMGPASPVRFKASEKMGFIFRVASQREDPRNIIQFSHVVPNGVRRRLAHLEYHALGGGIQDEPSSAPLTYDVRKYGTEFFLLTPKPALQPGEYVLSLNSIADGFFFGVDA